MRFSPETGRDRGAGKKAFFSPSIQHIVGKYLSDFCPMISMRTFDAVLTSLLRFLPLFGAYLKVMYDVNLPRGSFVCGLRS